MIGNLLSGVIFTSSSIVLPPVAGYKLWLDAADTSTIIESGGDVSQWNDKSGNASNFTQATGANQPKTGTRTINSKNVLDFDGSTDRMSCPSSTTLFKYLHSTTGGTVFFVGFVDNTATGKVMISTGNASGTVGAVTVINDLNQTIINIYRGVSGSLNLTASSVNTNTITPSAAFYLTTKFDGGNATAANRVQESLNGGSFNGSNVLTNAASSANSTGNLTVGMDFAGNSPYDGVIGEVIIYEGILSGGDITLVQNYLANKWGI
jgi:hypothetical protein